MAWFFWVWIREKCHEIEIEQNQPSLNSITFFLISAVEKGAVRLTVIHLHSYSVNRRQKWKAKRRTKYFLSFNLREFWRTHIKKSDVERILTDKSLLSWNCVRHIDPSAIWKTSKECGSSGFLPIELSALYWNFRLSHDIEQ